MVTFNRTITLHWNGETIHAFHVEHAHTDGDAIVHYVRADVFHMGDTFFNGFYPFIDVDSGGNVDGVIASADLVLRMAGSRSQIIPGHGELATREDLMAYREMLSTVRHSVAELVRDGKSQEEAVAAHPTAEFDAAWATNQESADRFRGARLSEPHGRSLRGSSPDLGRRGDRDAEGRDSPIRSSRRTPPLGRARLHAAHDLERWGRSRWRQTPGS